MVAGKESIMELLNKALEAALDVERELVAEKGDDDPLVDRVRDIKEFVAVTRSKYELGER